MDPPGLRFPHVDFLPPLSRIEVPEPVEGVNNLTSTTFFFITTMTDGRQQLIDTVAQLVQEHMAQYDPSHDWAHGT